MFVAGIFIALAVSLASGLFLWARCVVGARADEAAEACWSGWEIEERERHWFDSPTSGCGKHGYALPCPICPTETAGATIRLYGRIIGDAPTIADAEMPSLVPRRGSIGATPKPLTSNEGGGR